MPSEQDGVMIILSSPSGAGKTTLVKMLSKLDNFDQNIEKKGNITELSNLIRISTKIKANIVEQDEREKSVRAHLNFGHTFAHAIESVQSF